LGFVIFGIVGAAYFSIASGKIKYINAIGSSDDISFMDIPSMLKSNTISVIFAKAYQNQTGRFGRTAHENADCGST